MLTPLDLVVGLPVNGLIAPCAPSPSFWASYFNRIFSYISRSLLLSFRKSLLVDKHREGVLKGLALASRAILATVHYEMQNITTGTLLGDIRWDEDFSLDSGPFESQTLLEN